MKNGIVSEGKTGLKAIRLRALRGNRDYQVTQVTKEKDGSKTMAKTKSSIIGKLRAEGSQQVHDQVKDRDTRYGSGGDLPAGIDGGIAQIVQAYFKVHEDGDHKGKVFAFFGGTVKSPGEIRLPKDKGGNVVRVRGMRTTKFIPCYSTQRKGQQGDTVGKTFEENWDVLLNELRMLGVSTADVSDDEMEDVLKGLQDEQPHFRFRTWSGSATEKWPNPRVNEQWQGVEGLEEYADEDGDEVEDETNEDPDKEAPEEAADDAEEDVEALGEAADSEDVSAAVRLTELAAAVGLDPNDYDTWADVVVALGGVSGGTEEEEEEEAGEEAEEGGDYTLADQKWEAILADVEEDEDAQTVITNAASEAGIDPDEYETWVEVVEAIAATGEGTELTDVEPEDTEFTPEKSEIHLYKPPGAKKSREFEVMSVNQAKKIVGLKALDNDKRYNNVPWAKLEED